MIPTKWTRDQLCRLIESRVDMQWARCPPGADLLEFSRANNKFKELEELLEGHVYSMSLLSGRSCPGALQCKAWANKIVGGSVLQRGKDCVFTCFSASQENQYPATYTQRERNFDRLRSRQRHWLDMAALIYASIPKRARGVRWHVAGDIFSYNYLLALVAVAWVRPDLRFYGYTKSLHFLSKFVDSQRDWPRNLKLALSVGGAFDRYIDKLKGHSFHTAKVVLSTAEAIDMSLKIDHNDSLALAGASDFALLIHGPQAAGSAAGAAVRELRASSGFTGYGKKGLRA